MLYIEIFIKTLNKANIKLFSKKHCKYKCFFKQFLFFTIVVEHV